MTEQLDNFFNEKGIKKSVPEFNPSQETKIQSVNDKVIKPVLQQLAEKLTAYSNCKADMMTSKKEVTSIKENVELKFYRTMTLKFVYRPKFSLEGDNIFVTGQYCIPNLYNEAIEFKNASLNKNISDLTPSDITDDFSAVFTSNVDIK